MRYFILFVLLSMINLVFGQIHFQRFVAYDGYNIETCGTKTIPCKSIQYTIDQIKEYGYDQYSIEILLGRGEHHSPNPTNLYGLNITIGVANPMESVLLSVVSLEGSGISPQFVVKYPYRSDFIVPTNIVFRDFSVSNCNNYQNSELGSFFQSNIGIEDNVFLNVNVENVNFLCSISYSPYFSVADNFDVNGDSSSYSSSGSSSYYADVNKNNNNNPRKPNQISDSYSYSSGSFSSYDDSSSSYDNNNNNYNNQGLYMNQIQQNFNGNSYPNDNINISITFDNCQFGSTGISTYIYSQYPFALNSYSQLTIALAIVNTNFNSLYIEYGAPLSQIYGGSFTMKNVSINGLVSNPSTITPLFYFHSASVVFNQVNINGSFTVESLLKTENCIVMANQFNLLLQAQYSVTNQIITLKNSFAYFENSTIVVTVPTDSYTGQYDNVGVFNPVNSQLYLFSNRISSNATSIIYSQSSTVLANNNQFEYAPYSINTYVLISCLGSNSKFIGDSSFTMASDSCQRRSFSIFWNSSNFLEITLAFLSGILSIVFIFILMFTVSAIAKCSRRKRKALQKSKKEKEEEAKSLLSVNSA